VSFRTFLKSLENRGDLIKVNERISPKFEIAYVMSRLADGPALIFESVEGFKNEVAGNVVSTRRRVYAALNVSNSALYKTMIEAYRDPVYPKIVDDGPVMENVREPNLLEIPALTHYERDAGPYITAAVVAARSLDGRIENVSIHRLLVLDKNHLAIRLVPRHLHKLWETAKNEGYDLDVGIAIGVHPAVMLAAASSPPFGVSEFGIANKLLKGNLKLLKCKSVEAYVPYDAELVLEGKILRDKEVPEGPLVDMTGTYDVQRMQPVIEVTRIMHRNNYIYQALLPGGPEHRLLMGLPREVAIYESVSKVVPTVKAVNLSEGGCGWLHAVISIEKQTDGDAKNAILAAFAAHGSLKHVIVVDSDIDVYEPKSVEWALATRFQADEDLIIIRNVRGSTLDPSADQQSGLTTKLGVDATMPLSKPKGGFEKAQIPPTERAEKIIESLKQSS